LSALGTSGNPITKTGGDDAPRGIYYQDQKKRKIKKSPIRQLVDDAVDEYYKEIIKGTTKAIQHKAAKIVKPYAEDKKKIPEKIDWIDFSEDITRVKELLALYQQEIAQEQWKEWIAQDDEIILNIAHEHDKAVIKEYFSRFYNMEHDNV